MQSQCKPSIQSVKCRDHLIFQVLLVGMGADEQFAGYARHRTSYQLVELLGQHSLHCNNKVDSFLHRRAGWEGVVHEVSKDLNRISSRNLGRDDRFRSHILYIH